MGNISAHCWQSDSSNNDIPRGHCQTNSLAAQNSLGFFEKSFGLARFIGALAVILWAFYVRNLAKQILPQGAEFLTEPITTRAPSATGVDPQ